jgi:8-amino-7-oxononanoate synthase
MMSNSALVAKLTAALASRDERRTRRYLADTCTAVSSPLIDFASYDYLSFSKSQRLRELFLLRLRDAPDVLGSGGSRLQVNGKAHTVLEERLRTFFGSEAVLVFNSGYDANFGFFSCVPQLGDVVVHDEYIHASVHDGMRASHARHALFPFSHNCLHSLRQVLEKLLADRPGLRSGTTSVFLVVESVYSMEGTASPLLEMVELLESLFPKRNAHVVVDEVHATGIYGPQGRGRVAELRLESRVLACIHGFGKALSASGGANLLFQHRGPNSKPTHYSRYYNQHPGP